MAYNMDYDPPDGLAEAVMEGRVDDMTKILENAGDDFPVFEYIYGEGVKNCQVLRDPTALTLATEYGRMECVKKILLELGNRFYAFGVEMVDDDRDSAEIPDDYFSALILAFSKGHKEIFQFLIDFRLFRTPGIEDCFAEFVTAAKQGDFLRIGNLLDEVEDKDNFINGWKGHNIMNMCLLYGCPSGCLQKMIDLGIGVNGWDYNGLTPLMCAIIGKNLECVRFLLDKGADPYALHIRHCRSFQSDGTITYKHTPSLSGDKDKQRHLGPCALMYAAAMGNIPILKLILKAAPGDIGASERMERFDDWGPLIFAIAYGNMESIRLILQYKAARENVGDWTFILVMERDDMALFELLLEKIPPLTWKEGALNRVIDESVFTHNPQYLARLCEAVGEKFLEIDGGRSLYFAIDCDKLEYFEIFFKLPGFEIDTRYRIPWYDMAWGATCFEYSCRRGKFRLAEEFLKKGADVNIFVDVYHRTPVLKSVWRNDVECLKFLINANADLDVEDDEGFTVFTAALTGDGKCLEILLRSKKLFEGEGSTMKLKQVHRQSLKVFDDYGWTLEEGKVVSFKAVLVLMECKVFYWDWCQQIVDTTTLRKFICGAVASGLSPGKIRIRTRTGNQNVFPLIFAMRLNDVSLIRYLLANSYFLPEDYRYLLKHASTPNFLFDYLRPYITRELKFLHKRLTHEPLSLQTWSLLTISETLVVSSDNDCCAFSDDRNRKVDMLPLPESLKDILKFKTKCSRLCFQHWNQLGPRQMDSHDDGECSCEKRQFDEIVMDGKSVRRFTLEDCIDADCKCEGLGKRVKPVDITMATRSVKKQ